MKTCTKCNLTKESNQYTKSNRNKDGLYSSCKQCRSTAYREYRVNHKDELNAKAREYKANNK